MLSLNDPLSDLSILSSAIDALRSAATASGYPTIFIATTSEPEDVASEILTVFKQEVEIKVCSECRKVRAVTYDPFAGAIRERKVRHSYPGNRSQSALTRSRPQIRRCANCRAASYRSVKSGYPGEVSCYQSFRRFLVSSPTRAEQRG